MNTEQPAPPPQPSFSSVASAKPSHSNRASPFPTSKPGSTTSAEKPTMAAVAATAAAGTSAAAPNISSISVTSAPSFVPGAAAFRGPSSSSHSPFSLSAMSTAHLFDREPTKANTQPIGTPFASTPIPLVRVLIRRLPLNTSEESLRLMVAWSNELSDLELLPVDKSEDEGFRSALLRFRSMAGAFEVKNKLDGRAIISNDAEMIVEILSNSPPGAGRATAEAAPGAAITSTSAPGQSAPMPAPRQPPRFNGAFVPLDNSISPTSNGAFPTHEFMHPDPSAAHYQNIFSPQSPIGNHLTERHRMTSKTLISSDYADDDETTDLLKDPVAYAEGGGAIGQRRATAPQIPIGRMASLSLQGSNGAVPSVIHSTNGGNHAPGPSSLPPYGPISPANAPAPGLAYPPVNGHGPGFPRHNFPPVNPADQNPPCNTLYVGNLPIDTSEEELKAMFSKQRGYKRLCFRTKQNGPMCFVEFEDVSFATKALHELYGQPLHNSVKGGIRLSFSKNPLGVRSGQAPGPSSNNNMGGSMNGMNGMSGMMGGGAAANGGYGSAHGPPPGLAAPPGLGAGRGSYNGASSMNTGGSGANRAFHAASTGFPGGPGHPWNAAPGFNSGVAAGPGPNGSMNNSNNFPRHMMGR